MPDRVVGRLVIALAGANPLAVKARGQPQWMAGMSGNPEKIFFKRARGNNSS